MIAKTNMSAIKLATEFFKGNYALSFAAIAILLVISFFSFLPLIGILFVFAYSVLSLSIQIYFGKNTVSIKNEEEMKDIARNTQIGEFLTKYFSEAAGAFLGLFILSLVFMILFMITAGIFGTGLSVEEMRGMNEQEMIIQMITVYSIPSILFLLIGGFLFYIFPSVMGEIFLTTGFNEALKKVFLLLSPNFWKKTFNKNYFILIIIWSIIVFIFGILIVLLSTTVILLPLVLIGAYLLSLYNAAIYVFAKESLE